MSKILVSNIKPKQNFKKKQNVKLNKNEILVSILAFGILSAFITLILYQLFFNKVIIPKPKLGANELHSVRENANTNIPEKIIESVAPISNSVQPLQVNPKESSGKVTEYGPNELTALLPSQDEKDKSEKSNEITKNKELGLQETRPIMEDTAGGQVQN